MAEVKDSVISYETLYELARREKGRDEVQELGASFFADALKYLRDKQAYHDSCMVKTDIFSLSEREKTSQHLQNAKRLLRELYERREKKMIELALNKSRTNSGLINTTNLLPQEKVFYDEMVAHLNRFRDDLLVRLLSLQEPLALLAPPVLAGDMALGLIESASEQPGESSVAGAPNLTAGSTAQSRARLVRFTAPVDKFVGEESEPYGPFKENDKAYLPTLLADILISNGSAVELQEDGV